LQVQAGLAQLDAQALDLADPKSLANQLVEAHTPRHDVSRDCAPLSATSSSASASISVSA
jgi:hypothetical protein